MKVIALFFGLGKNRDAVYDGTYFIELRHFHAGNHSPR